MPPHREGLSPEEFWTSERIARFWDLVAGEPRLGHTYFSLSHAQPLVAIARLFGMTYDSRVLDFGCGPGHLSQQLATAGLDTTGFEHSAASAESANLRLKGLDRWNGCFTASTMPESMSTNAFDWVFSVEAYEHLREEWIPQYFMDIKKYLKRNGYLLITTPNNENLDDNLIICPCCESRFHRWGHLRSVTHISLRRIAEHYGFEVITCHPINLEGIDNVRVTLIDRVRTALGLCGRTVRMAPGDIAPMLLALLKIVNTSKNKPHLLLVARKI
jgi:2-polyprenyl-3-methyl-5-hydroxy-6-metoxy-1,4-benzoquinol methylase